MIAIKTDLKYLPEYCDLCRWHCSRLHPTIGWTYICELCSERMDDDCREGWHYDGDVRPEKCPLIDVDVKERTCALVKSNRDDMVKCSSCSSVMFNNVVTLDYCPRCGAKVVGVYA